MGETQHKPEMEREELRDVISLSLWAGQMLLQNGADTQRVEKTIHQLGTALGCDWLDIVILPDAIIASTINNSEFRTKVRRAPGRGVDMQKIADISDISFRVVRGELDRFTVRSELNRIDQLSRNYNRWFVVFGVGLACAAFSRLFEGDGAVFIMTLIASSTAMFVRQELHKRNFNTLLTVVTTAFVAGALASLTSIFALSPEPTIAIAASVLLLVPGVPLVNASEDLLNGHTLTGVLRGVVGMLLVLSIALGWAEVVAANDIFIGVNAVDYSGYPDCRPDYIAAYETMANLATKSGIEGDKLSIKTPLMSLSKSDIISKGLELGVDYSQTVSCYQANDEGLACGKCDSCYLRRQGFTEQGIADPTRYV